MRRPIIIAAAVVIAAAGATAAAAAAGGDDDATDRAITGGALDRAKAAALADTPGKVTETEVGDEESYYEVEVTRPDGSQVDVQLDRDFRVVGSEADGADDQEGDDR
jgi:uncharacterized membrane protein YkoI